MANNISATIMKITPIIASKFISDGGAMFGLVPKPIWSKLIPADENNGIPQNANSLFIELDDGRKGLVDTGCGMPEKFSDKERQLHGLEDEWLLQQSLDIMNTAFEDIDFVIFTHLHWDHAGGAGIPDAVGALQPTFPNAVHFVHAFEWDDALSKDPLLYKSYPPETIAPLTALENERLVRVADDTTVIMPGIEMILSGGHTRGHCIIRFQDTSLELNHPDAGNLGTIHSLIFAGDILPTRHHLRMVFQTAYDTFPLQTRAWKLEWRTRMADSSMPVFFDHDPDVFAATIQHGDKREFITENELPACMPDI